MEITAHLLGGKLHNGRLRIRTVPDNQQRRTFKCMSVIIRSTTRAPDEAECAVGLTRRPNLYQRDCPLLSFSWCTCNAKGMHTSRLSRLPLPLPCFHVSRLLPAHYPSRDPPLPHLRRTSATYYPNLCHILREPLPHITQTFAFFHRSSAFLYRIPMTISSACLPSFG